MLRESKVIEQMELLGIKDITTDRQTRNGTVIWQLPIKMYGQYIEVGSFKSGYVRRMNGGYTPYQLNKRNYYDHYYKSYDGKWVDGEYVQKWNGKYNKMTTKGCILIPKEIDRLEYLISYCLKNYYIKQANMIEDGKFVPKWKHELRLEQANKQEGFYSRQNDDLKRQLALLNGTNYSPKDVQVIIDGQKYKVI
jgi:hypothetical protein